MVPWARQMTPWASPAARDHRRRTCAVRHSGDGSEPSSVQYFRPSTIFPPRTVQNDTTRWTPSCREEPPPRETTTSPAGRSRRTLIAQPSGYSAVTLTKCPRPSIRSPLTADRPLHRHVLAEQLTESLPVPGPACDPRIPERPSTVPWTRPGGPRERNNPPLRPPWWPLRPGGGRESRRSAGRCRGGGPPGRSGRWGRDGARLRVRRAGTRGRRVRGRRGRRYPR